MRPGLLALSAVCLLAAPAVAQPPAAPGLEVPLPTLTTETPIQNTIASAIDERDGVGPRVWGSVEFLRWWITPGNTPPLIQTVPTDLANVGSTLPAGAATTVFPSQREIKYGAFNGIRPTIGFTNDQIGFDVTGFWLENKSLAASVSSDGTPFAVAQQYVAAGNGIDTSLYASLAGKYIGGADASTDVRLWGFDANVRAPFYKMFTDWNHGLAGFRYFNLEENLYVNSNSTFPNGAQALVNDAVRTRNEFYGGQIGLASRYGGMERGFGFDGLLKLALGGVRQQANLSGSNTYVLPNGVTDTVEGGLYVQPTNAGIYERTKIAMMTEYNLNLTYNFNPNWQISFGYSIVWISSVIRPAESLDPVVNDSRIRYVATPAPSTSNTPAFSWNRANDFWTQGVNVGLRVQY